MAYFLKMVKMEKDGSGLFIVEIECYDDDTLLETVKRKIQDSHVKKDVKGILREVMSYTERKYDWYKELYNKKLDKNAIKDA